MQVGSVDDTTIELFGSGLSAEALRASRTPAEISEGQTLYVKTKEMFEHVVGDQKMRAEQIEKMLEQFNELAAAFNIELRFNVNKSVPNHISVKMVNTKTNEVIREIPVSSFSAVGERLLNAVGLIVDEMV